MKNTVAATAAALLLAAAGTAAGSTNLIVNGGFEQGPAISGDGYARGVLPTGWDAVQGLEVPDILSNAYNQGGAGFAQLLHAHSGDRYLDMNGASSTGGLSQTISGLVPLSAITVTFWTGQWAQNSAGTLVATLSGQSTVSTTVPVPYAPDAETSQWSQHTLTGFASASGTATVSFTGDSTRLDRGAPGLDDVVVTGSTTVPEPGAWALMIGGFGLAGAGLRRRRGRIA